MKPRLRAEELIEISVLPRAREVRVENLSRCCLVPMSKNSVLDGFRQSLFWFIQLKMSVNVEDKMLIAFPSVLGVKDM